MNKTLSILALILLVLTYALYEREADGHGTLSTTGTLNTVSADQLWDAMRLEHVVGGYVAKTEFTKEESPLLWVGSLNPKIIRITAGFLRAGGGTGLGTEFYKEQGDAATVVDAVSRGQITCEKFQSTTLSKQIPDLSPHVRTKCVAALPPFSSDSKHIIVLLIAVSPEKLDVLTMRKHLVKLQVDLYNREYLGIETWKTAR